MENSIKKSVNNGLAKISRVCLLSLVFFFSFISSVYADSGEPSLEHLKKNTEAGSKELEKLRNEEIMSYVYMTLGFAVVIAIAWSTTVMARKRNKREQEEKQRFILKQQEMRKHSGTVHKARR